MGRRGEKNTAKIAPGAGKYGDRSLVHNADTPPIRTEQGHFGRISVGSCPRGSRLGSACASVCTLRGRPPSPMHRRPVQEQAPHIRQAQKISLIAPVPCPRGCKNARVTGVCVRLPRATWARPHGVRVPNGTWCVKCAFCMGLCMRVQYQCRTFPRTRGVPRASHRHVPPLSCAFSVARATSPCCSKSDICSEMAYAGSYESAF